MFGYKKISACIAMCALCIQLLSGCAQAPPARENDGISVACTLYPVYDWIKNITAGVPDNKISITLIAKKGVDMHSFQPSVKDIADADTADLFVYLGGESDRWAADTAENMPEENTLCLFDALGDSLAEENNENTAVKHDNDRAHSSEEHDEHSGHEADEHGGAHEPEKEYDEHIWLSLRLAAKAVSALCEAISEIDPPNAAVYEKNASAYCAELNRLDGKYASAVENSRDKTVVLADRFPFLYLMNDYGITCYAAFPGCSADTEADFRTIVYLIEKVNEHQKDAVLVLEGSDFSVAETVIAGSSRKDARLAVADSCQSPPVQSREAESEYLSVMERNLEALTLALQ